MIQTAEFFELGYPADGSIIPTNVLSNVDLPAPFGPTIPTNAPDGTANVTSLRTVFSPYVTLVL